MPWVSVSINLMLDAIFIRFVLTICFMLMTLWTLIAPCPMTLKQLIDVCERYSTENEITYNATKTVYMYIRPKHMCHISPVKQFLYGHELRWVDECKYLGCNISRVILYTTETLNVKQEQHGAWTQHHDPWKKHHGRRNNITHERNTIKNTMDEETT